MNKLIKINIEKNYTKQVSLKNLLKDFLKDLSFEKGLDLEINIKPNITLDLLDDHLIKSKIKFVLDKNSKLSYFSKPNESANKELTFELIGFDANAQIKILCNGKKDQAFNFKTIQDHKVSSTKSNLIIKGVFDDISKLKSDNLIKVAQNAQNVVANQINKNILIGEKSGIVTIPKMEIKSDKVNCHHGAAISKLDENQLFYLQSRGLDLDEAKKMLITAFLG
ncbi:MAG: SufD family Fe-S cluster assembly protein [bacterium]